MKEIIEFLQKITLQQLIELKLIDIKQIIDVSISFTSKLLAGICLYLFFWLLSFAFKYLVVRLGRKFSPDKKPIFGLLANIVKIAINLMGIITALGSMGVNVSALVTSLGISSFALSFAMKEALSNVLAGIMVLIYQPFQIGIKIKVGELQGVVIDIDLRYITIQGENKKILIPNASILNQSVIILDGSNVQEFLN